MCSRAERRYRLGPDVRLRPVPEMGACLAYRRGDGTRPPALHRLNATNWAVVSLCDGREALALRTAFSEMAGGRSDADALLAAALGQLLSLGLIDVVGIDFLEGEGVS